MTHDVHRATAQAEDGRLLRSSSAGETMGAARRDLIGSRAEANRGALVAQAPPTVQVLIGSDRPSSRPRYLISRGVIFVFFLLTLGFTSATPSTAESLKSCWETVKDIGAPRTIH